MLKKSRSKGTLMNKFVDIIPKRSLIGCLLQKIKRTQLSEMQSINSHVHQRVFVGLEGVPVDVPDVRVRDYQLLKVVIQIVGDFFQFLSVAPKREFLIPQSGFVKSYTCTRLPRSDWSQCHCSSRKLMRRISVSHPSPLKQKRSDGGRTCVRFPPRRDSCESKEL